MIRKRFALMAGFSACAGSFLGFLPFTRRVSPRLARKREQKSTVRLFLAGATLEIVPSIARSFNNVLHVPLQTTESRVSLKWIFQGYS